MVHSSQVQLTRDDRALVVAEPDAVTLVELRGRSRLPLAAALVRLDREIQSITRWALRASLSPGDPRRLGHGNEGLTAARDAHT
jgi:hypothetical protein